MQHDMQTAVKAVLDLKSLLPSPEVNTVMTQLVNSVIHGTADDLRAIDPPVQLQVRNISAEAETEMEKAWATRIVESTDPNSTLQSFPYIDNYVELTRRELKLVVESGLTLDASCRALIIGSGPLPLSAYEMHRQTGMTVDHVDSSKEAIELCERVNKTFSIESNYYHATGEHTLLTRKYDLILVAALAGSTLEEKQRIIDNILPSLAHDGRIIVRSARGARELLYPAIEAFKLRHVKLLREYHPEDYIINSVLVYGKE